MADPIEALVEAGLEASGLWYRKEPDPKCNGLDFYIEGLDVFIECKQFHTDRIAKQTAKERNIIVVQGMEAAVLFSALLAKTRSPSQPIGD